MTRGPFQSLRVVGVGHAYEGFEALKDVSFEVSPGKSYAILGPNGSGKTTLFHILTTAMAPSHGRIEWNGQELRHVLTQARGAMGVVFQVPSLDRKLTVIENLRAQGGLFGIPKKVLEERIREALHHFSIEDRSAHLVETLSGGLARRVEIAKSLLHDPAILFMDEPSSSLDPVARIELRSIVSDLVSRGKTVVLTTHLLDEADACDENLILHEGKLVAMGSPKALKGAIDRKIVFIRSKTLEALRGQLVEAYGVSPERVEGGLRLEVPASSDFARAVIQSHGASIEEMTYRSPTLEDVFIHYAKAGFNEGAKR